MLLEFNGFKIPAQLVTKDEINSKHTGASLEKLEVRIYIESSESNEDFLSLLRDAEKTGLSSIDEAGCIIKRWTIVNTSWSYTQGEPGYYHTIELTEEEDLNLTSLDINGIILHPYFYKETFEDDLLQIEAKVVLDEEGHKKIKTYQLSNESFPVIRHGINEQPLEMSLGRSPWSKNGVEYKHKLFIFQGKKKGVSEDFGSRIFMMNERIAFNKAMLLSLFDLLKRKDLVTEIELEQIEKEATNKSDDVSYEFNRFEDIDELELD